MSLQHPARVCKEHSRTGDRTRQLASAGLHRLPRHSYHQGPQRSQFHGGLGQRAEHLCLLPWQRETIERIRGARRPGRLLSIELSRNGGKGGLNHGCQLRQLPWRAQHSAAWRPALHRQPRQSGQDLRTVPSWRQRQVHHQQGTPGWHRQSRFRQQSHRFHQPDVHLDDCCRDWRHGAAQSDRLPQEADPAPHWTTANSVPYDLGPAHPWCSLASRCTIRHRGWP